MDRRRQRRHVSALVASLFVSGSALLLTTGIVEAAAPAPTLSRYMSTASSTAHYDLGCDRARRKVGGPMALIYGKPIVLSGAQAVSLYAGPDTKVTSLASPLEQFVQGYRDCAINAPLLTLIIATTNCGQGSSSSGCVNDHVTNAHGVAWANLVDTVNTWTGTQGYYHLVDVQGGSDIEPDWDAPTPSRAWVDGYASATVHRMYDVGSADGCPQTGTGSTNGSCDFTWHMSDVFYVAWGAQPSLPLPQIYTENSSQAKQWKILKLYGVVSLGRVMGVQGSLTQHQACIDNHPPDGNGGYCDTHGTFNTASAGWTQLQTQLNSNSNTAQSLPYSTDINWNH